MPEHPAHPRLPGLDVLDVIHRRVLWLAARIVDSANHDRDTGDGVKVGGPEGRSDLGARSRADTRGRSRAEPG